MSAISFIRTCVTLLSALVGMFLLVGIPMIAADDGSGEQIDGDLILMQGEWNLVENETSVTNNKTF